MIHVVSPGAYATVQDLGRPGYAHLGVPRSGATDQGSLRLANRLVGNADAAAGIELTFGGAVLRFQEGAWVALAGAPCPVEVGGRGAGMCAPIWAPPGALLRVGLPFVGLRTYLAIRGGLAVPEVLGSRSTDSLSGLGPPPLRAGDELPVGDPWHEIVADLAPQARISPSPVVRVTPGPRDDWFEPEAMTALCAGAYEVSQDSNRIGARLSGTPLLRAVSGELPSEGMVLGAVQVPPSGQPIVFLADHPPTGGYPVIAVVDPDDVAKVAQLRPGDTVSFSCRPSSAPT